jgi:excisionase family DNA binding protein
MAREWLSVSEVATELDTSAPSVWRLLKTGRLPSYRLGGRRRILREDLKPTSPRPAK